MLRAATGYVRERIRQRGELVPLGFTWAFVVVVDVTYFGGCIIATLQRPTADLPAGLIATAVGVLPFLSFLIFGMTLKVHEALLLWVAWCGAAAIFLFATTTPVGTDFAPLLLVLVVGAVGAMTGMLGGLLATVSAVAMLIVASTMHRVEHLALYLSIVGMGWLVGWLMHIQQQLMIKQQEAQAQLAEHAAADERRRIAREVHDVVAHSLSVTLLHTTAARRGLQEDRDIDDAVEALEQAEQLGRQAMADIRRTVGLLDDGPMRLAPEPGAGDIAGLVDDFVRAGLNVTLHAEGPVDVTPAVGLALYRITQESLANVAKHAPDAQSTVTLTISRASAMLAISNQLPVTVTAARASEGRGLRGMRQRVELLGGRIDIGPANDGWSVSAEIPLGDTGNGQRTWGCGS